MKTLNIILLLSVSIFMSSCHWNLGEKGNGNIVREQRHVGMDFDKISSSAGTDVYITQGNINEIIVETDENLVGYIDTNISNGELSISTSHSMGRATRIKIYVTFIEVNSLRASSGSEINGQSLIKSEELSLRASSGAEIAVEVLARNLDVKCSSGSQIDLKGRATSFSGKASSGSGISAKKLEVISAIAQASSGADIKIAVKENLDAKASSGGSIRYSGNPQILNANKSSSGSVKRI